MQRVAVAIKHSRCCMQVLDQVLEFRPLRHIHARQVQHADALTLRPKQRCPGTAIDGCVRKKMLATMKPDRLMICQCRTNGGRTDRFFGQVYADRAMLFTLESLLSIGPLVSITTPRASVRMAKYRVMAMACAICAMMGLAACSKGRLTSSA